MESHQRVLLIQAATLLRRLSETWENLKNAAIGMATARISEFIEELVPGFSEHYNKAASGRPVTPFSSDAQRWRTQ